MTINEIVIEKEEWVSVKGYEGLYEISTLGNVKDLKKCKLLKRGNNPKKYEGVWLRKGDEHKSYALHRLVASNFLENPENKPLVNHKDNIKNNNKVSNLEWSTYLENNRHAVDIGAKKAKTFWGNYFGANNSRAKTVYQLTENGKFINEFKGAREVERILKFDLTGIEHTLGGNQYTSKGFAWRYKEDVIGLSELPHFVIQGEGNFTGVPMLVLRCVECDVYCYECDTTYSWNKSQGTFFDIKFLVDYIQKMLENRNNNFVMITGGAPSLQQDALKKLIDSLPSLRFQIEDAGNNEWFFLKDYNNIFFSFSPKIGALKCKRTIQEWRGCINLPQNYIIKVVSSKETFETDIKYIVAFQDLYKIPDSNIWIMPKGIDKEEIISQSRFLVEKLIHDNYQYNFSPRLHIMLFGNQRKV